MINIPRESSFSFHKLFLSLFPYIENAVNRCFLLTAIFSFFVDLFPELGCVWAAMILHQKLLYGIIRAPISFFDTTPTGRVLARFSSDINEVDIDLPAVAIGVVYCIFEVNSNANMCLRVVYLSLLSLSLSLTHTQT